MIDKQNNQFDNHEPNHEATVIAKKEFDESGYIFNYFWNEMLRHGKNMNMVKYEIEKFVLLGKLSVINDGNNNKINIGARCLCSFLRFYKSNLTTMQIKALKTDVDERCALAKMIENDFLYNGHLPIKKSLLKTIKSVFSSYNE